MHGTVMRDANRLGPNADLIGMPGGAALLTTPALVIDLPALRRNLRLMQDLCTLAGMKLRPHAKTHKCAEIALEQAAVGAIGVCCATPHEAIALAGAGVHEILLTSPVVQPRQVAALAEIHHQGADLSVTIDHPAQVALWEGALAGSPRRLPALVDIDIGMARTGVASPEAAVEIARLVEASACLAYAGAQAYSGIVQHIPSLAAREAAYCEQLDRLDRVIKALGTAGLSPGIVSGGGTGTFALDAKRGVFTESQAGSYIFMDVEYNAVELFRNWPAKEPTGFETSLFLRASVISANAPGQVTLNAGFKSFAADGPLPQLVESGTTAGCVYGFYGDEFGRISVPAGLEGPRLGSTMDLVTPHCDPTVNLHDMLHVVEDGALVDIWQIVARGVL